ncbi:hypothetical protein FSARC_8102 [Fusarium sarcochroum]|uniref:Uncharacterized protein n=1 Tax=Fusarium sarcochroum TaxID=1208366 RepID=A0A8H4TTT8_9HYPO|nr:hypothetical protein FSARC_8102 [Fusarium sarcochroum]
MSDSLSMLGPGIITLLNNMTLRDQPPLVARKSSLESRRSSLDSRRSSLGSRRDSGGVDGLNNDDDEVGPGVTTFHKFIDDIQLLDGYFEGFLAVASGNTSLIRKTKNLHPLAQRFEQALELFGDAQLDNAYIALSKRFNERKKNAKGKKKVVTVSPSFGTAVGDGDSQSTETNTPRKEHHTRDNLPPKTPRRSTRSRQVVCSDSDDTEEGA